MSGKKQSRHDVVVIGAGIAGCAVAAAFSRQGRQVLLIERNLKEPDRIVGELLQPGGVDALSDLGLANCLEGIDATPIEGYHLYWRDEEASFWFCDLDGRKPEGRSFHHGKFVSKLREAVASRPGVTVLEGTVNELLRDENSSRVLGVVCTSVDDQRDMFYADLVVLADGPTSNFRSQFTSFRPQAQSRFWGLEITDSQLPIPRYAHSVLGRGPPILMYPIDTHTTRILIDIPDSTFKGLGNSAAVRSYTQERVVPVVPDVVQPGLRRAIKNGRVRSMPNASMASTRNTTPGLIMVGDASNMRHPITGSGMTVAFKDAVLLANLLNPTDVPHLGDSDLVLRKMRDFHWKRKSHSAALNILARALYLLFVSEDESLAIMQRGFIRYVQEGEKRFAEPAWIMGGLTSNPFGLFYHFVFIAIYSIRLHLRQASSLFGWICALGESASVLVSALGIIWGPLVDELRR